MGLPALLKLRDIVLEIPHPMPDGMFVTYFGDT